MNEEKKRTPAEKAIDKAEAKARARARAALVAWLPLQLARLALANDGQDVSTNAEVDAAETLNRRWLEREGAES